MTVRETGIISAFSRFIKARVYVIIHYLTDKNNKINTKWGHEWIINMDK
jgi:hypothetical protein